MEFNKNTLLVGAGGLLTGLIIAWFFFRKDPNTINDEIRARATGGSPIAPVNVYNQPAQSQEVPTDPEKLTSIQFENIEFNFGSVKEGEKVRHLYKFKNTGSKPLTIINAAASCGCTVPKWSKEPIAPGATGEIEAEFDSKGKVGAQTKTVTVTANTTPSETKLILKGEVIGDPNNGKTSGIKVQ